MRILLVDDHTLFREALLHVLKQFAADAIIIEAATAEEAIHQTTHYHDLDLILLDLGLPGVQGLSALPELRERAPTVPLVVVSASENPADVRQALAAGAAGYIPKSTSSHTTITALRLVMAGEVYVPPSLLAALEALAGTPTVDAGAHPASELTPRQVEIVGLMGQGFSNKAIAKRLQVAEGTVKLHVTAILRVLKTSNRTQAVIEASRRGLIPSLGGE